MALPGIGEHLQLLTDMVSDAVLVATTDGAVIGCNTAACRLFGYSRGELTSLQRGDVMAPEDERVSEIVRERERKGAHRGSVTLVRRGGERFEAEVTTVAVTLADNAPQVWVVIHDIADRQRAEAALSALRESNELLRALTDAAFEAVLVHREGIVLLANRAAEVAAGVDPGQLVGRNLFDFIAAESHALSLSKVESRDEQPYEAFGRRANGKIYPLEVRVRNAPVNVGGEPARVVALRDLSAQRQLEEQYQQAQKMEAVGRLAGGIAHDFNNLLSVILNATTLAADDLAPGHPSLLELAEVTHAAERAAELTTHLLAFSRKQVLRTQVVDAGTVVRGMATMIRRLIGEDIELVVRAADDPGRIKADPAQLELMVMNLVVNARHAMPDGGRLTMAVEHVVLDDDYVRSHLETRTGPNVMISVADTGKGMDEAVKARIFEPFFTTKGPGQGTGLGLATVFGIVKQSGGSIWVESALGKGSTFKIYFPCTPERAAVERAAAPRTSAPTGKRTVLVVEDEDQLRRVVVEILHEAGYDVLEAGSPSRALEVAAEYEGPIQLLISDVVMPELSGKQLAERLVAVRPELRVLYVSGYTQDSIVHHGVLEEGLHFLPKPFTRSTLLATVARVLA